MRPLHRLAGAILLLAVAAPAAAQEPVGDFAGPLVEADRITADRLRRTIAPDDPWAPPERRIGALILSSSIDVTLRGTSNAAQSGGGGDAVSVVVEPEVGLRTDWSRHGVEVNLRGAYEAFADGAAADEVSAGIDGALRLDIEDLWQADFTTAYDYGQQEPSDPDTPDGLDGRPGIHTVSAGAQLSGGPGRLRPTLAADVVRTVFADGTSGGLPVDQGDRDNTVASARLRLGYEAGTLTPFVEAEADRRVYDRPTDSNGFARASTGGALRAGIVLDRGPVLEGELAIGVAGVAFDDPAFDAIRTLTVDGSLVWAPTRLHTVTANVATALNPSTDVATSGSVDVSGDIGFEYAWTPQLTVGWRAGYGTERFEGVGTVEHRGSLDVEGRWRLSPHLELTALYTHEFLSSPTAGRSYEADTVQVGVRYEH